MGSQYKEGQYMDGRILRVRFNGDPDLGNADLPFEETEWCRIFFILSASKPFLIDGVSLYVVSFECPNVSEILSVKKPLGDEGYTKAH